MPDRRTHRGAHPDDALLFGDEQLSVLRAAAEDFCWLLTRGYAPAAALKLVGDQHRLVARQRAAILRSSCDDASRRARLGREIGLAHLVGTSIRIDAFNVILTVEAALGGAVVLEGRDGCYRDLGGIHGSYRKVVETLPSLQAIGSVLADAGVARCLWLLDAPVSNSGRLAALLRDEAIRSGSNWRVEIVRNPDALLELPGDLIATADAGILDRSGPWINLARHVVERSLARAWVVALFDAP